MTATEGEYTEMFAKFIISARESYDDLCEAIKNGGVPGGQSATIKITIPAEAIDRIRFDIVAAEIEGRNGNH